MHQNANTLFAPCHSGANAVRGRGRGRSESPFPDCACVACPIAGAAKLARRVQSCPLPRYLEHGPSHDEEVRICISRAPFILTLKLVSE